MLRPPQLAYPTPLLINVSIAGIVDVTSIHPNVESMHSIQINCGGPKVTCRLGDHVLGALLLKGRRELPAGCHGGGCGVCRVRIIKGDYECLPMSTDRVTLEERDRGLALACRVFPRSDMIIEAVGPIRKAIMRRHNLF